MKDKNLGQFEILDRTHVIMENISLNLYEHHSITKKQKRKVGKALGLLMDVYQSAGMKVHENE